MTSPARRRVVVAVPERAVREALARFLRERGFEVAKERTVAATVAHAGAELDAVVCARGLADGDPAAIVQELRAAGSRAAVIVLFDDESERIAASRVTCIAKPVRLPDLAAALDELAKRATA